MLAWLPRDCECYRIRWHSSALPFQWFNLISLSLRAYLGANSVSDHGWHSRCRHETILPDPDAADAVTSRQLSDNLWREAECATGSNGNSTNGRSVQAETYRSSLKNTAAMRMPDVLYVDFTWLKLNVWSGYKYHGTSEWHTWIASLE